jgi:hypothetical protein|tara:strand:+ start:199 stop:342 length:144 start_codon:yes stop_codon:yes gene_type:complete
VGVDPAEGLLGRVAGQVDAEVKRIVEQAEQKKFSIFKATRSYQDSWF